MMGYYVKYLFVFMIKFLLFSCGDSYSNGKATYTLKFNIKNEKKDNIMLLFQSCDCCDPYLDEWIIKQDESLIKSVDINKNYGGSTSCENNSAGHRISVYNDEISYCLYYAPPSIHDYTFEISCSSEDCFINNNQCTDEAIYDKNRK